MSSTYLITGGCGFLGSNIAQKILTDHEGELIIIDNFSRKGSTQNLAWLKSIGKFTYYDADVRDYETLSGLIHQHKPKTIFHFAGQVAMTTSIANPRLDFEINTVGTLNILESVRCFSPATSVIYSSTNKVYGDLSEFQYVELEQRYTMPHFANGVDESVSLNFHSPYGCSKGAADQYVLDYARIYGLKTAVFRHSSMYGGRQFSTEDQGWIGWFCEQAILQKKGIGKSFTISGNGKQVRDILHARDMVELYMESAKNITKLSGSAFNIGGGINNSLSILELLAELGSILNVKLNYEHIKARESDQLFFVANLEKIKKYINWSPKVSNQTGLQEMIEWVTQHDEHDAK